MVNHLPGGNAFASYFSGEKIIFNNDLITSSLNNLYNSYIITDEELNDEAVNTNFVNIKTNINSYLKTDANYEFRFIDKALFTSINNEFDKTFFELDTEFEIYKDTIGFQDEKFNFTFNNFKAYLPDCLVGISKYLGMSCLVVDENGELLLFVIGSINNNNLEKNIKTRENIIRPIYGDLFKLPNLPTVLQRF